MIYTKGTTELDGVTYEATEADYNSYDTELGQTTLDSKTYYAQKKVGLEQAPIGEKYKITQVLLENNTYQYILESASGSGANIYDVNSIPVWDGTQELQIIGG